MIDIRTAPWAALVLRATLGVMFVSHALLKYAVFTLPGTAKFFESLGLPGALGYATFWAELIGGIAMAARAINPSCRVVGVEAAASCAFHTSVREGRLVEIVPGPTLADGLGGNPDSGTITFPLIQKFVHDIVTVTEDEIRAAIKGLVAADHLVAEGAGAVATAAVLAGRIDVARGSAALVLSGGNIDVTTLQSCLSAL